MTPATPAPPVADAHGMPFLTVTLKPGGAIVIGDDIEVSLLGVTEIKARLGVEAPRELPVFRVDGVPRLDGLDEGRD